MRKIYTRRIKENFTRIAAVNSFNLDTFSIMKLCGQFVGSNLAILMID